MPDTALYHRLNKEVTAAGGTLVAVSKKRPTADIMALYELGHRDFGENRVAELVEKHAALPKDIRWHFIGHLQRNKVRAIAPFIHLIHAVDSERLLREIDKQARAAERVIPVLLQFHVAREESKYGLDRAGADELLASLRDRPVTHARIAGLMGMATYTDDREQVSNEFQQLADLHAHYKAGDLGADAGYKELSMGMSGDYPLALERGSTLVRVGSLLFGG